MGNRLPAALWEAAPEHQNNTDTRHILNPARYIHRMVKRQDACIGNLLFYDYVLVKRTPTFLQRNLTDALHAHQRELQTGSWLPPRRPSSIHRSMWRPPSPTSLKAIMKSRREQEALVIDINGIEPLKSDVCCGRPPRKKAPFFMLYVDIDIALLDPESGLPAHEITRRNVKMAGLNAEKGKVISLDASSVEIAVESLLRPRSSTRVKPWDLRITLRFQNAKDAKEFHSQMSPTSSPTLGGCSMHLTMQQNNILRCPSKTEVYPFKESNLGLKLLVYWRAPIDESALATHNRRLRSSAASDPVPPPQDPHQPLRHELIYLFPDNPGKVMKMKGLLCPHLPCSRRNFSDIDQLRIHLDSLHDLFKYQCRKMGTSNGVENWELTCEVKEYQVNHKRASNAAPDALDAQVLAPGMPFDKRKYLDEGNDDYQKEARLEISRKPASRPTRFTRSAMLTSQNPDSYIDDTSETAISKGEKKTYVVPKAPPGVTFFRAITKRPLQEGECVSESDDDVDTEWVQHKQNARNDTDPSIPGPAKRFLKLFDPFIRNERLHSDQRFGVSLVRFARLHTERLWQEDIVDEFKAKLDELLEDSMIPAGAHRACLDIVNKNNPSRTTLPKQLASLDAADEARRSQSPLTRSRAASEKNSTKRITPREPTPPALVVTADAEGDIEMRDPRPASSEQADHPMDKTHDEEEPPYDLCLCGEDAGSLNRPFVFCENVDCIRHAYHIACIKRHWPDLEPPDPKQRAPFTCRECLSSSPAG